MHGQGLLWMAQQRHRERGRAQDGAFRVDVGRIFVMPRKASINIQKKQILGYFSWISSHEVWEQDLFAVWNSLQIENTSLVMAKTGNVHCMGTLQATLEEDPCCALFNGYHIGGLGRRDSFGQVRHHVGALAAGDSVEIALRGLA